MAMKKSTFLLTALILLMTACGTPNTSAPTSLPATITPTPAVAFTDTPLPPKPTHTPILVDGTLTTQVNVRSGPAISAASLGLLNSGGKVRILSKDGSGSWYQILYPSGPQGLGWVAAQYVHVAEGAAIPFENTPTPAGPSGRVMQKLNVRSGPATTFSSLGMLDADALVPLTGKNAGASWFQIAYASGPGGRGWVTAQYIQTDAASRLPVLDDFGTPVAADTQSVSTGQGQVPSPTVGPAADDGDSKSNPATRMTFSAAGTHLYSYSSQVSAPQGDPGDWIEFIPYASSGTDARLRLSLTCSGNGLLVVELFKNGAPLSDWGTLVCGDADQSIRLPAGQTYALHLVPTAGAGERLVSYTLTIQNEP
jgi:uncharacterized protein YraI